MCATNDLCVSFHGRGVSNIKMSLAFAETANVDVTTTPTKRQGGDGQIGSPCKISRRSIIAEIW